MFINWSTMQLRLTKGNQKVAFNIHKIHSFPWNVVSCSLADGRNIKVGVEENNKKDQRDYDKFWLH